jgi:hypothetical protein
LIAWAFHAARRVVARMPERLEPLFGWHGSVARAVSVARVVIVKVSLPCDAPARA